MTLLPAAIGIVLDENDKSVLLTKRRDVPIWVLPGGGIEVTESPLEAIVREIQEESGLNVHIIRQCAEYTPINRLAAPTSVFICKVTGGKMTLSDETTEINFFPIDKLPPTFFPIHAHWLKEGIAATSLIQRPLSEVSYSALILYLLGHPWQVIRFAWTRFAHSWLWAK